MGAHVGLDVSSGPIGVSSLVSGSRLQCWLLYNVTYIQRMVCRRMRSMSVLTVVIRVGI